MTAADIITEAAARKLAEMDPAPRYGDVRDLAPDAPANDQDPSPDGPDGEWISSWLPRDVADTVAGLLAGTITRPEPELLHRSDGRALLYRRKVNGIAGASGDGKSFIAQSAAVEVLAAGGSVVYVDLEDDEPSVIGRLLALGADPAAISERFRYASPEDPYGNDARDQLEAEVVAMAADLVVIDSTGEALALDGARPNDDDEVARWNGRLGKRLARLGPAVLLIDHMPHDADGRLAPIGSQRKRAMISGAQYITDQVRPFSQHQAGMVKLLCGKDRGGNYRRGEVAAEVTFTPTGDSLDTELIAPPAGDGSNFRPTVLMERVSRHLEAAAEPLTTNAIKSEVQGNGRAVATALGLLVAEGYVERETVGQAHHHRSVKPYREHME